MNFERINLKEYGENIEAELNILYHENDHVVVEYGETGKITLEKEKDHEFGINYPFLEVRFKTTSQNGFTKIKTTLIPIWDINIIRAFRGTNNDRM